MGRARGANAKLAGAFETAYGTPPAGGYIGFPFVSSDLGAEQGLEESDLLGNGREAYDPTYGVITNDGNTVVPVDVRYFGYWLKLLLGAPTTTGSVGEYSHLFTSGKVNLPSMSIETQFPDVPSFAMSYGIRANTLQIQMQRAGLLNATLGLVGKGEDEAVQVSGAGVLAAALEVSRFAQFSGEIKREGVRLGSIVSANLAFTNALDKIETIQPDGEIEDADGGTARATGNIVSRYSSLQLQLDATNKIPVELSFGWSFGDFGLTFTVPRVFLPRVKNPINGPGGVQATYNWQASGEGEPCLTALLVNDKATY